jgi:hypothetical protein
MAMPTKPVKNDKPARADGDFSGTLGNHEMEQAAKLVLEKADSVGLVWVSQFKDDLDLLNGFVMLAGYGWLTPDVQTGSFRVSSQLLRRLRSRGVAVPDTKVFRSIMRRK